MRGSCCIITRQMASHSERKNMNQRCPWKQETDPRSSSATPRSPGQPEPREILSQNKTTVAIRGPCSDTVFFGKWPFLVEGWAMPSVGTWGRTHLPGGWKAPLAQPLLQSQSQGQSFLCPDSGFPCFSWLKTLWLPGIVCNDSKWLQRLRGNLFTSSDAIYLAQPQTVWVHSKTIAVCTGALALALFWPLSFPHLQKWLRVYRPTAILINSVIHQ